MRHILIIEDHILIAKAMADIVRSIGATSVEIVSTVEQAVEAAAARLPSMIISDVDLSDGGYGPDAVSAIRQRSGDIPAIFVTARPDDSQALAIGTVILAKPVSAGRLAAVFSELVPPLIVEYKTGADEVIRVPISSSGTAS